MEPQLQRLAKPLPINALNALRDGASCSDAMGCGRYVGAAAARVKPCRRHRIVKTATDDAAAHCPAVRSA
jgi:hypothetical protein